MIGLARQYYLYIFIILSFTILHYVRHVRLNKYGLKIGLQNNSHKQPKTPRPKTKTKTPIKQILFLKTHKTGSSSVQNIMFRLAEKHKYPILWNKSNFSGICLPKPFEKSFSRNLPKTVKISTNHLIYSDQVLDMFQDDSENHENIFKFTILREPFSQLISQFNYYSRRAENYCFYLAKDLKNYLDNFDNFWWRKNKEGPHRPVCRNQNSFDLGMVSDGLISSSSSKKKLNWRNISDDDYRKMILNLEKRLDLVLILEKYYESMILLKESLNLTYEDVISFKLNRALPNPNFIKISKNKLSKDYQKYKNLTNTFNKSDFLIYSHFYKILIKKIKNYGEAKMAEQVEILKNLTKIYENDICKVAEIEPLGEDGEFFDQQFEDEKFKSFMKGLKNRFSIIPWHPPKVKVTALILGIDENDENYEKCLRMILPEIEFSNFLREKQMRNGLEVVSDWNDERKFCE